MTQNTSLPAARPVVLSELEALPSDVDVCPPDRLSALKGVRAEVSVMAGHVVTTVGEILGLKEGAVLAMETPVNAPFDIVLNGVVIARGDLVVVGEHFGIRVSQVQTPEGR